MVASSHSHVLQPLSMENVLPDGYSTPSCMQAENRNNGKKMTT